MAVYVDLICLKCDKAVLDQWSDEIGSECECGGIYDRLWTATKGNDPNSNPRERCVIYVSEKEGGKIQYPGRNDVPVPKRLESRGYRKVEMNPRDVKVFERKHNLINHALNYDRNGRYDES